MFAGRTLPVSLEIALCCTRLNVPDPQPYRDGLILNPAVGRLLPLQTLYESNTCAHDDLHLMGESAARPQVCRFRPLALLLAPPGQAVRGALAPSLKTCFVSPSAAPNCRI